MVPEKIQDPLRHTFVVDASCDGIVGVTGIGIIHKATDRPGRSGPVIATYSEAYIGIPPRHAEEFALLRALEIAIENGASRVKLRSDANAMRRQLKRAHADPSSPPGNELRLLVLRLASTLEEVKFSFVPRRKNIAAHRLARLAVHSAPPRIRGDLQWGPASPQGAT